MLYALRRDTVTLGELCTTDFVGQAERLGSRSGKAQVKERFGLPDAMDTMVNLRQIGIPFMLDGIFDDDAATKLVAPLANADPTQAILARQRFEERFGPVLDQDLQTLIDFHAMSQRIKALQSKALDLTTSGRSFLSRGMEERQARGELERMLPEFVGLKRRSQVILVDIIAVRFAQTIAPVQTAMLAPPSATPDLEVSQKRTYKDIFNDTVRTHVGDQYEHIKHLVDSILSPFVRECCVVVETTHQKNVLKVVKERGDYDAAQDVLLHMDIDWSDQSTWTVLKMMYDERERQTFNGRTFHEILGASSMGEGWTRFQILIQAVYGNTHAFFAQTRREHYGDQVSARIRATRMRSQYEKEILQLSTEVTQLEARRGTPGAGV